MTKQLTVEVWSDIACPWCYVGKRRFEAALAKFPHKDQVLVVWRAFELDPSAPAVRDDRESYVERLAMKYGTAAAQASGMIQRMVDTAKVEGIDMDFERIRAGNTFTAHRLLQLAKQRGLQDALEERFFAAYLSEGEKIGDPETLVRLAVEAGLDLDEVTALVATDLYTAEVRADQQEARQIGVDGVPFFLLGRRYAIPGAQPAELLLEALQKTWDELPEGIETFAASDGAAMDGAVCGPDGCT